LRSLLIDTNVYTHALKGDPEVVSLLRSASRIGISSMTLGELLSGFKAGNREAQNRKELMEFLDSLALIITPALSSHRNASATLHRLPDKPRAP
jgi:tRNA(fMet)-specific endonuclease VapC